MKKWLALLCAIALLLSLGTAAFASGEASASEEPPAEASGEAYPEEASAEEEETSGPTMAELGINNGGSGEADPTIYDGVVTVINHNGLKLTYHKDSGVTLLYDEDSGYYFKDLNKNGKLDVYEDWRNSSLERAEDLAAQMPLEQMLCLMFHHEVNDDMIAKGMRFELIRSYGTKANMAAKNNQWQLQCESTEFGIPMVISTDPRHTGTINAGYVAGQDGELSQWPETMGMSSAFDPETFETFGDVLAAEFRAMGITMLLGPQVDLITEPRWGRNNGAITEDYTLNADLGNAYVSSMQTSDSFYEDYGLDEGWGPESVAAVTKHWPSGGAEENGYDAHNEFGKFAVYPADGFDALVESFAGASGLSKDAPYTGASDQVAAVMPYYTISMDQNPEGENVGNGFSHYIVTDLLRGEYDFGGVVMTDWMITGSDTSDTLPFTSWGLEAFKGYDVSYRYYKIITAGVDQFGGAIALDRLYEGYDILANGSEKYGVEGIGEEAATARIRESAVRILRSMFNLGIFESAYTDPDVADAVVGSAEFVEKGYEAHLDSAVLLKNSDSLLPLDGEGLKVYVPVTEASNEPGTYSSSISLDLIEQYYDVPDALTGAVRDGKALTDADKAAAAAEADFAIVKISSPSLTGTTGVPQSLQYAAYTVTTSRAESIGYDWMHADGSYVQFNETPDPAKGDYKSNRSILGTTSDDHSSQLDALYETIELMGDKPVIVIMRMTSPAVVAEFEPEIDAFLVGSGVADQAMLEIISGGHEPSGLLSVTLPLSMETVDASKEDIPDTTPYVDTDGNAYAFGFGLNWSGVISDARTAQYAK